MTSHFTSSGPSRNPLVNSSETSHLTHYGGGQVTHHVGPRTESVKHYVGPVTHHVGPATTKTTRRQIEHHYGGHSSAAAPGGYTTTTTTTTGASGGASGGITRFPSQTFSSVLGTPSNSKSNTHISGGSYTTSSGTYTTAGTHKSGGTYTTTNSRSPTYVSSQNGGYSSSHQYVPSASVSYVSSPTKSTGWPTYHSTQSRTAVTRAPPAVSVGRSTAAAGGYTHSTHSTGISRSTADGGVSVTRSTSGRGPLTVTRSTSNIGPAVHQVTTHAPANYVGARYHTPPATRHHQTTTYNRGVSVPNFHDYEASRRTPLFHSSSSMSNGGGMATGTTVSTTPFYTTSTSKVFPSYIDSVSSTPTQHSSTVHQTRTTAGASHVSSYYQPSRVVPSGHTTTYGGITAPYVASTTPLATVTKSSHTRSSHKSSHGKASHHRTSSHSKSSAGHHHLSYTTSEHYSASKPKHVSSKDRHGHRNLDLTTDWSGDIGRKSSSSNERTHHKKSRKRKSLSSDKNVPTLVSSTSLREHMPKGKLNHSSSKSNPFAPEQLMNVSAFFGEHDREGGDPKGSKHGKGGVERDSPYGKTEKGASHDLTGGASESESAGDIDEYTRKYHQKHLLSKDSEEHTAVKPPSGTPGGKADSGSKRGSKATDAEAKDFSRAESSEWMAGIGAGLGASLLLEEDFVRSGGLSSGRSSASSRSSRKHRRRRSSPRLS